MAQQILEIGPRPEVAIISKHSHKITTGADKNLGPACLLKLDTNAKINSRRSKKHKQVKDKFKQVGLRSSLIPTDVIYTPPGPADTIQFQARSSSESPEEGLEL